jgi:hypothetical protein
MSYGIRETSTPEVEQSDESPANYRQGTQIFYLWLGQLCALEGQALGGRV